MKGESAMYNYHGYPIFNLTVEGKLILLLAIIWSLIWKGMALWRSAQNGQKAWFIIMLIVNTLGILEIVYLVWFSKKNMVQRS